MLGFPAAVRNSLASHVSASPLAPAPSDCRSSDHMRRLLTRCRFLLAPRPRPVPARTGSRRQMSGIQVPGLAGTLFRPFAKAASRTIESGLPSPRRPRHSRPPLPAICPSSRGTLPLALLHYCHARAGGAALLPVPEGGFSFSPARRPKALQLRSGLCRSRGGPRTSDRCHPRKRLERGP